jgi:hypothetical protein
MILLKEVNKGPYMNSFEQFYIQLHAQNKKLVPEQNTGEYNPLFYLLYDIKRHHAIT